MSVVSKKNATAKKLSRNPEIKSKPGTKYIGLDEKNEEAERVYKSLTNPELLRK